MVDPSFAPVRAGPVQNSLAVQSGPEAVLLSGGASRRMFHREGSLVQFRRVESVVLVERGMDTETDGIQAYLLKLRRTGRGPGRNLARKGENHAKGYASRGSEKLCSLRVSKIHLAEPTASNQSAGDPDSDQALTAVSYFLLGLGVFLSCRKAEPATDRTIFDFDVFRSLPASRPTRFEVAITSTPR